MSTRPLPRVRRNICVLLLALLALSWGYFAFTLTRDYQTIEQQCHNHLETLAIGLQEHVRHTVQSIDVLLLEISRHFSHYSAEQMQETVRQWFNRSPQLAVLAIIDLATGEKLLSLNGQQLPAGFSSESYASANTPVGQLQIDEKLYTGNDGRYQLALSRQFRWQQRELLAVFFLYADVLLDFHPDPNLGPNGSVAIFNQQGLLLARSPQGDQLLGRFYTEEPLFHDLLPVSLAGVSRSAKNTDGISRIIAYRKVSDLPLVVTVGTSIRSVFAGWEKRLVNFLIFQVAVSLSILISLILLFRTLTRVEIAELGLVEREEHFRSMADSSVDAVISVNGNERVRFWSVGAEQTFGCPSVQALNMPITCFLQFAEEGQPLTLKQLVEVNSPWSTARTLEIQGQRKNGEIFPTELSISRGRAAGRPLYTLIVRDVTERRQMEERIRRMASHDNLTGLPNRALLMDRLQVAMAQVRRQGGQLALLFIDLDQFKPVNDNYGHDIGDLLLRQVADRMLRRVRASDTVARIGGDEFALLLTNIEDQEAVCHACQHLLTSLEQQFRIKSLQIDISCSIGVAIYAGAEQNASELIKLADNAMYAAKRAGKNCYRFAAAADSRPS